MGVHTPVHCSDLRVASNVLIDSRVRAASAVIELADDVVADVVEDAADAANALKSNPFSSGFGDEERFIDPKSRVK
jgi:hypothetical protein